MDGGRIGTPAERANEYFAGLPASPVRFWRNSFTHLAPSKGDNVVESNLSVLAPLGLDSYVTETTMSYNPVCWERVRQELNKAGVGERAMW